MPREHLRSDVDALVHYRVVRDRESDYSPMNDLNMIAGLGIIGIIAIAVADLRVLGLI
jgi:hypothetical protein